MTKNLNFEQAMMRLNEIIETLERSGSDLETSIDLFEEGLKSIFMTIFGIGICGMYLYSDIKMIMNNKKVKQ